jgi:hypothetical protein
MYGTHSLVDQRKQAVERVEAIVEVEDPGLNFLEGCRQLAEAESVIADDR